MGVRFLPAPAEAGVGSRLRQERSHDPDEAPERTGFAALARVAVAGHLVRGRCEDVDLGEAEPLLAGEDLLENPQMRADYGSVAPMRAKPVRPLEEQGVEEVVAGTVEITAEGESKAVDGFGDDVRVVAADPADGNRPVPNPSLRVAGQLPQSSMHASRRAGTSRVDEPVSSRYT